MVLALALLVSLFLLRVLDEDDSWIEISMPGGDLYTKVDSDDMVLAGKMPNGLFRKHRDLIYIFLRYSDKGFSLRTLDSLFNIGNTTLVRSLLICSY